MTQKKVLIVGGYGTVGSVVSEILAGHERVLPVIAGRNESRARALAHQLGAEWRTLDINHEQAISAALSDIDVVVNCFSGPFTHAPLLLPELSARHGIHYLDVAGSYEYAERFLDLNELALQNNVILMTALGANPGIPGIAVMSAKDDFDILESARILFVLGAKLDGISAASLKELKYMFEVKPLVWERSRWRAPSAQNVKEPVGAPFSREVYLSVSLTRDLLVIPELTGVKTLSFWSGSQFMGQGLIMLLGLKMGFTRSDRGAQLLLNGLKRMGRAKAATSDALLKIVIIGKRGGVHLKRTIELYGEENYASALAPAIVCQQIVENKITRRGACAPPVIVPATDFMKRLEKYPIHYSATEEEI